MLAGEYHEESAVEAQRRFIEFLDRHLQRVEPYAG